MKKFALISVLILIAATATAQLKHNLGKFLDKGVEKGNIQKRTAQEISKVELKEYSNCIKTNIEKQGIIHKCREKEVLLASLANITADEITVWQCHDTKTLKKLKKQLRKFISKRALKSFGIWKNGSDFKYIRNFKAINNDLRSMEVTAVETKENRIHILLYVGEALIYWSNKQ